MPNSENEEIKDDIAGFKEINAVALSKGGRKIISGLREDILSTTQSLTRNYKIATHMELVALCADLDAKLSVYNVLTNTQKNIAALEDILELEE